MTNKKQCIIFDLDGTLADLTHRLHYIKGEHKDYKKFYEAVGADEPIMSIVSLVWLLEDSLYHSHDHKLSIFILSGRSDECREDTKRWLEGNSIYHNRLWMRPEGDYQKDTELKRSWLHKIQEEGYEVLFTVDDRQSVVDMWREEGITCLQAAQWDEEPKTTIKTDKAHLHVMVGPSGAGKTHYAMRLADTLDFHASGNSLLYISTDQTRSMLCGDFEDQSRNDEVFEIYHADIRHNISMGRTVIADATNLIAKSRKNILKLLPEDCKVTYHIIDRPLEDKLRDDTWRHKIKMDGKGLIETHHERFKSAVKYALEGDGDPRVTVEDHR